MDFEQPGDNNSLVTVGIVEMFCLGFVVCLAVVSEWVTLKCEVFFFKFKFISVLLTL